MQTLLTGSVLLVVLGSVLSAQQAPPSSDEFRKAFLEQFHRTGLNTAPGDAMMLRILVESRGAKLGVEVGAASGFGAINMGIGFERNGGRLYSLEINPKAVAETRENLEKVALEKTVTVIEGDALQNIPKLPSGIDFVFIDAAKNQYLGYLKGLEPKLLRGAVVVADNVIKSARAMKDFLDYIQNNPQYETVIIRSSMEKDDGMLIAYKVR